MMMNNLLNLIKIKVNYYNDKEKFRFLYVGAINTFFGLVTFPFFFYLTRPFEIHYIYVLISTQFFMVGFSFLTNKYIAFRSIGSHLIEFMKFSLFHLSFFLLNLIFLPVMVEFFKISPVISQFMFSLFIIITSYFWYSRFTFLEKNKDG
jgi:putative flippase GtrA